MMSERSTAEWLDFFKAQDVPASSVVSLDALVDALPEAEHPSAGRFRQIPPAVRFDRSPQSVRRPAPLIGQHTEEVLSEAGYDAQGIASLRHSGALPNAPGELS